MKEASFNLFLSKENLESIIRSSLPVSEPLHYTQEHREMQAEVSPPAREINETTTPLVQ